MKNLLGIWQHLLAVAVTVSLLITTHAIVLSDDGDGGDGGGENGDDYPPCQLHPPNCQGESLSHLPLSETLGYQLDGWWELHEPSSNTPDSHTPRTTRATLHGRALLTRVSPCTLRITLTNVSFSDWPMNTDVYDVDTWVRVSGGGGGVESVCGVVGGEVISQRASHLHALARSIASAAIDSSANLDSSDVTVTESDHMGDCPTHYHLARIWPSGQEVVKTRDLTTCSSPATHTRYTPLSALTNNASWSCVQQYSIDSRRLNHPGGWLVLQSLRCSEAVNLRDAASTISSLTLTRLNVSHPQLYVSTQNEIEDQLRPIHLDATTGAPPSPVDQNIRVYDLLTELCTHLESRVSAHTTLLYPRLLSALTHLPKEALVQLYHEVSAGRICPQHQRLRGVLWAALRDSTTPAAAAAKCHLMTSRTAEFSHAWSASLSAVKDPTAEALISCAELLGGSEWEGAVLGVATMAGWAARNICQGDSPSYPCQHSHTQCSQDHGSERCRTGEAVNTVVSHLSGWLARCSSHQDQHQVLLAIRGLGNVGRYGGSVELRLRQCGETNPRLPVGVRVAAVTALGRGPCSLQIQNWLKWEVLNETMVAEIRIAAFMSLRQCSADDAEAVATLITQRQSHSQVKSFLRDFVKEKKPDEQGLGSEGGGKDDGEHKDPRQFSRHLLANLTSLMGLPDTTLEADLVFQNSFLPRSLALNLSSPLLSLLGGSAQGGIRLENLEDVLQSIIGPGGLAREGLGAWVGELMTKLQELFTTVTQEFVDNHRRKRSHSPADLSRILAKVRREVMTEIRGWVWGGVRGRDWYFSSFSVDPFALDWQDLLESWLEQIFDTSYSALVNSDAEYTSGWSGVSEEVVLGGLVGVPVVVWRRAGVLTNLLASSQLNLLSLITNPTASTINIGLKPSGGMYYEQGLRVATIHGPVTASTATVHDAAGDIAATLVIQGGDRMELKLDLPETSVLNKRIVHTFETPPSYGDDNMQEMNDPTLIRQLNEDGCDIGSDTIPEIESGVDFIRTAALCNRAVESALGLRVGSSSWTVTGRHTVARGTRHSFAKSLGVDAYKLAVSWKNPGSQSMFLDVQFETEDNRQEGAPERKAGLVFGLTYAPHYTLKVQLHAQQFNAFLEASLVNDPNLKRIDGHIGFLNTHYGIKAELLMVTDGGHMTVKPRLVIAYPGRQEDALLEGYMARYHSDKVSSITLDLYTEGSLKQHLDLAVKGTVEKRRLRSGATIITLKNIHLTSPPATLGLEAALSHDTNHVQGKVQVTWGGEVVVVDGSLRMDDPEYLVSLEVLLPSHPHLDTHLTCLTTTLPSQVVNNLTLTVGQDSTRREFQLTHSTAWRVADMENLSSDVIIAARNRRPSFRVDNAFALLSEGAGIDWSLNHSLEVSERAVENLVTAQLDGVPYNFAITFYDQSEDLLKYQTHLQLNLGPLWNLNYTDTLEETGDGVWVGRSSALMPSSRRYTTLSTLTRRNLGEGGFLLEVRQEVGVEEAQGLGSWSIIGEESFLWTASNVSLRASLTVGETSVFGIEASLVIPESSHLSLHLKTWAHDLYDCEVRFGSEGRATDLSFTLLIIPFNREIRSEVAVGHDECTGGSVDGQVAWGTQGDPTRTLTFSSALHFPQDSEPLQLRVSLSVLGLSWDARLEVLLGEILSDSHHITFTLLLPDMSRFEIGCHLDIVVDETEMTLLTGFYFHSPDGEEHNVTLSGETVQQPYLSNTQLELHIDSPISEEIKFITWIKKEGSDQGNNFDVMLRTHSEAELWRPIGAEASGWWNESRGRAEAEVHWGDHILQVEGSGWHREVEGEHTVEVEGEIRRPTANTWKQLSTSIQGTFSMTKKPPMLKMQHNVSVVVDGVEMFNTSGEAEVSVPNVEGRLALSHWGNVAAQHTYTMEGKFTGKEVELEVEGVIDGTPVRMRLDYEDGRQVRLVASYRNPNHFSLILTTHLNHISIGFRRGGGTNYSLSTEGELLYRGHTTRMTHHISISPSQASSTFTLDPLRERLFKLRMIRNKLDLNHWETDVGLSWGERVFNYHDEVVFPSLSEFWVQVMVDAPTLNLHHTVALVEAGPENDTGQVIRFMLTHRNITMHSARMMFYKYDAGPQHVWEAGVREVVVHSQSYRDMTLYHAFTPLTAGMEVKSNMTLGETPVVAVGVKLTEHTRALVLGLCTTAEECVRLHAHTHSQATLASRTFTLAAHALNSLFWKGPEDPLIQNTLTLEAQHTPTRMEVSGGLVRVECAAVNCLSSTPHNLLHAALQLTHNTLDLTVNTTERTMVLTTVLGEGQARELSPTSLPGGRLIRTAAVVSQLWLDRERDPQGVLTWTSNMAAYSSARAAEKIFHSSLSHPSISKPLVVRGNVLGEPSSTSVSLVLDVFTRTTNALILNVALQHLRARHILSANLTKYAAPRERVMGLLVTLLPSPDNGEVSVMVMLPPHSTSASPPPQSPPPHSTTTSTRLPAHQDHTFNLACKMDTRLADKTISCKTKTATVSEEVSLGYREGDVGNCWRGGVWLALFNRTFSLNHNSCNDPPSTQTALTKRVSGSKEKLALRFGLVDASIAEVELLGSAGVKVQLHPPFLLHTTAHHQRSIRAWLQHVWMRAKDEMRSLIRSGVIVFRGVVSDMEKASGVVSSVSAPTPSTSLSRNLRRHVRRMIQEARRDQLMLDVVHGARACLHVTSVILEAGAAYLSHNYGGALLKVGEGARVWSEAIIVNTGAAILDLITNLHNITTTMLNIIADLPHTLLTYAMSVPLVSEMVHWTSDQLHYIRESLVYIFIRDASMKVVGIIQEILSFTYKEGPDSQQILKSEEVWNVWVPLVECGHSLPEVWQTLRGVPRTTSHSRRLTQSLSQWWQLITHPHLLMDYIAPPFPAEGVIIGDHNMISVDGRTFSTAHSSPPGCSRVLLTDTSGAKLFTLVADWDQGRERGGTNYTLTLPDAAVEVRADFQIMINKTAISLPYIHKTLTVKRDDRKVSVTSLDRLGREIVSLVCWAGVRRSCVVGANGWFHGDTRALLGTLNLEPANDFMRPSGKLTQSKNVFLRSWGVSGCGGGRGREGIPPHESQPSPRTLQLCQRFFLHYTSPVFACHDTVNIKPYYATCLRYLSSIEGDGGGTEQHTTTTFDAATEDIASDQPTTSPPDLDNEDAEDRYAFDNNGTIYEVNVQDVLMKMTEPRDVLSELSWGEGSALCDVAAAYSTICARRRINVPLPPLCEEGVVPNYSEPLSEEPEVDVVVVVSEDTCSSFLYQHLARPLPHVLARVATAKNISDIKVSVLGYGSGGGDIVYRSHGTSLLTPAAQLRITQPPRAQRSRASLRQAMIAVSTFPFRPGSVRVAILLRCDSRDIPKFTEALPDEMLRRRLSLFTLTPETLMFNPSRPQAVRNTIGMDRWNVYNLKLDRPHSSDSWGVKRPSSNIAQLAMKSGGGIFSVSELRQDPRARYYMKLFRRVLSKSVIKVVLNAYRQQRRQQRQQGS